MGPGDRFIAEQMTELARDGRGTPVVAVVTKADLVGKGKLAEHLMAVQALGEWADIVPVSATSGYNVDVLENVLIGHLPEGTPLYAEGELTDEPEAVMVAELVREAALEGRARRAAALAGGRRRRDRRRATSRPRTVCPCSTCACTSSSSGTARRPSSSARAARGCATSAARRAAGSRRCSVRACYLDLHVKVAKDWQRDPKQLGKLGF